MPLNSCNWKYQNITSCRYCYSFFENYTILIQKKSLLSISISFDEIHLAPFISFFFFIAVCKIVWFSIILFRHFRLKEFQSKNTINPETSFVLFTLIVLIITYLIIAFPEFLPFDKDKVYFIKALYKSFFGLVLFVALIIFTIHMPSTLYYTKKTS